VEPTSESEIWFLRGTDFNAKLELRGGSRNIEKKSAGRIVILLRKCARGSRASATSLFCFKIPCNHFENAVDRSAAVLLSFAARGEANAV
jgi:hypothetical protein